MHPQKTKTKAAVQLSVEDEDEDSLSDDDDVIDLVDSDVEPAGVPGPAFGSTPMPRRRVVLDSDNDSAGEEVEFVPSKLDVPPPQSLACDWHQRVLKKAGLTCDRCRCMMGEDSMRQYNALLAKTVDRRNLDKALTASIQALELCSDDIRLHQLSYDMFRQLGIADME